MSVNEACLLRSPTRTPWNKGKLIGAKPPPRPKHVWSIRTRLMIEGRTRDLAMFNLAIDSKLRAATSSPSRLKTSHRTAMRLTVRRCGRRKPDGR